MPDEATPAPEEIQDTQAEAAPTEEIPAESQQPTTNWEQRYNDLRPEYDRNNQLIAAARGDHGPEAQIEALQRLGVEVEQQQEQAEEPDLFEDPTDRLQRELESIKQDLASRDEKAQMERFAQLEKDYISSTIKDLEGSENLKLTAGEKRFVENDALANRLEDGRPDLEGAMALIKENRKEAQDQYLASKKEAASAPVGAVGEEEIDLSDHNARNAWMAKEYERLQSAGS
ncbi:MAG TPA: hypothetical protein VFT74_02780 [Isosphaeraceae bacterium]|nr:hypothetical protein [Isosphaeraceae bacterium]